ncbi:MAG: hypothetical protein DRQ51_07345 [Gammaproteobacteria bacterium]|nr:MAG: hypothetical protein DRQ51_07345 [Gammaproteobacteria bacterium]
MQAITLKIEDNTYPKIIEFLNKFKKQQVQIIDKTDFQSDDEYIKSIQGMEQSIIDASNEPRKNYVTRDELD